MKISVATITTIFMGVVLGGIALFGLYSLYATVHEDHVALQQVVTFINSQMQQTPSVTPSQK